MWLTEDELRGVGFQRLGRNVLVDQTALFFGAENIVVGSHVRIDAGALLSAGRGGIAIGSHVHIAAMARIFAPDAAVTLSDFVGLSSGVAVYSSSDSYTTGALTNPTVPTELRDIIFAPVLLGRHVVVGANSVVMPGVTIAQGGAVGALTFVNRDVSEGDVVAGSPMRVVASRSIPELRARERLLAKAYFDKTSDQ